MPLIQMETVSMMLDTIIRIQMNEITLYIEIKETACLPKYFLLP